MFLLPKNQFGSTPLLLLGASLLLFIFFIIISTFPIEQRLFSSLYPKPASHASTPVQNPTRLAIGYVHPKNRTTAVEMSPAEISQKFNVVIYHRQFNNKLIDLRNAGFRGEALQYILHDEIAGPIGLNTVTAQSTPCNSNQKTHKPAWENNISAQIGEFCQIHDSIVNKTAFDHDLNSGTPAVTATEDWFLHRKDNNERLVQEEGMPGGIFYRINPANQRFREYYIARALRELKGGDNLSKTNFDGVFLDNVQLSWNKVLRTAPPKEFNTSNELVSSVQSFVSDIYTAFHSDGNSYQLWANMIEGVDNGTEWDQFTTVLDGGLHEHYAINWGNGPYETQRLLNQMSQAEKWLNSGKHFVATGQGNIGNVNFDAWGKFTLATYLMVTDGIKGSFIYTSMAQYGPFYEYPEYYYKLGRPLAAKTQVSSTPLILRRNFECGVVEVNLTSKTSSITQTQSCIPSASINPTSTPTPTPSPTPSQTPVTSIPPSLPGDVDGNGSVDIFDFNILLTNFGKTGVPGDLDGNNKVDIFDYNIVLSNFGKKASTPAPSASVTSANSVIKVFAAGIAGSDGVFPTMQILINEQSVKEFPNVSGNVSTRQFMEYSYTHTSAVTASQVRVAFTNDNGLRDLMVDRININGIDYQTEAADTYTNSPGCPTGFTGFETLWCNGYFAFKQ